MRLNIGDLVEYDNDIYEVFAIIFTTLYLKKSLFDSTKIKYTIKQVYEKYHDIEILKEKNNNE